MGYTILNNKITLTKDIAFCKFLNNVLPDDDKKLDELIRDIKLDVQSRAPLPIPDSAFNNAAGDWYEWLLALSAWNYCIANPTAHIALLIPNVTSFEVGKLYNTRLYSLIDDLREKVRKSSGVQLISSNPDFVIINRTLVDQHLQLDRMDHFDITNIKTLENAFKHFIGLCDFDDIVGYLSVKASLRPDRRLQMAHEGSLMKALYTHLQTREWVLNPKGIKYYAMSTKIGLADIMALKTVATHSITTVHDNPQAAVDDSFQVNTLQEAAEAFQRMLH